ncbi:MAG: YceI family protein [Bacteroidota bacterium]
MKKMKFPLVLSLLALSLLAACTGNSSKQAATETSAEKTAGVPVVVNTDQSVIQWKGEVLGVYSHEGTLNLKSASLEMAGDRVSGGSFVADMTTMKATDENYMPSEGRTPEKLVAHLSSPDFFDVPTWPEASFVIGAVNGSTATGTLTIRGISHEETVTDIKVTPVEGGKEISGKLTFDRKKYNVSYDVSMKDMVLSNDILLTISLFVAG